MEDLGHKQRAVHCGGVVEVVCVCVCVGGGKHDDGVCVCFKSI